MKTSETSAFLTEIECLMDAKGIEDLEELYERFLEEEPERIGNAPWAYERFRRYTAHEVKGLYAEFLVPLSEALEATEQERIGLMRAWFDDVWGPPSDA
jgi:hypothetical protein